MSICSTSRACPVRAPGDRLAPYQQGTLTGNSHGTWSVRRPASTTFIGPAPGDAMQRAIGRSTERLAQGVREIYVACGERRPH